MEDILKEILALSKKDKRTLDQRFIKLHEEVGELAQAVLQHKGLKSSTKNKLQIKENILEEYCDSIITLTTIIAAYRFPHNKIQSMLRTKSNKWKSKLRK